MHKLAHSYSSLKMFDNCPLRYYKQRITKEIKEQPGEASIYGERVHKAFELRLKDGTPLPDYLKKFEGTCQALLAKSGRLDAELELVLNQDLVPTGWWDADAWLRSKLDVSIIDGTKSFSLDWKTGARRPDFFQLELSALQIFIHYPKVQVCKTGFLWLKDEQTDMETYRRADFDAILGKLHQKTERIEEGVWPAKSGPLCNWCPAQDTCMFADKRRRR